MRLILDDPTVEGILDDLEKLANGVAGLHILQKYLGIDGEICELHIKNSRYHEEIKSEYRNLALKTDCN